MICVLVHAVQLFGDTWGIVHCIALHKIGKWMRILCNWGVPDFQTNLNESNLW